MTRPTLSALVVARDEEAQFDECLSPLRFADELVVVLDRCVDASKAIAERHDARILEGSWPGEPASGLCGGKTGFSRLTTSTTVRPTQCSSSKFRPKLSTSALMARASAMVTLYG